MSAKPSLYGTKSAAASKPKSSATSLAFASSFSSLLAASAAEDSQRPASKSQPSKPPRDSIYATNLHSKTSNKKRALESEKSAPEPQKHAMTSESVDSATWKRSKRKMEEKARLYASMKRGDYVPPSDGGRDKEAEGLVDFDRKWAEKEDATNDKHNHSSSSDYDSDTDPENISKQEEMIEYEDEFGRMRKGTKAQAERERQRLHAQSHIERELAASKARPERPQNLIYGDTVQAAAFNPDEPVAAKMADIVRKRDRSMTPPEETHYDATKEVRTKGVGFFQFSKDEGQRRREMADLGKEREETEMLRREREERKAERMRKLEERRKVIGEKRGQKMAERFLDALDVP